jgi:hypothetical protein
MIAFSPIRQHPQVLDLFLTHIGVEGVELWVYDDNTDKESSALLRGAVTVLPPIPDLDESVYLRGEDTHLWNVSTYNRVAKIKNAAIDRFLQTSEDLLFLIDSDVLLQPGTLTHLDEAQLPILAAVYWTKWSPHHGRGPNMWGSPPEPLREPGHHVVNGLGACTLIRREVLEKGVRFDPQPGLESEGEDRWFCRLAQDAGFQLVMCSHVEPFHVYRDSEIVLARAWSADTLRDFKPVT